MSLTDQDLRALTYSALRVRQSVPGAKRWDEQGTYANIAKVRDRSYAEVNMAVIRAAADRDIDTPGVIPTNGSHWNETAAVKTFTPEKQLDPNDRCSVCYDSRADCRRKWTDDDHVFVSCAVAAATRRATAAEARARAVAVVKSAIEYPAERSAESSEREDVTA